MFPLLHVARCLGVNNDSVEVWITKSWHMEERYVENKFLQMLMLEGVSERLEGARRHTAIVASNF